VWDVDGKKWYALVGWYYEMWMRKKMGCPIRMGCKGDEKEKCIPKKDGMGWG
jgi:hypothetical protein